MTLHLTQDKNGMTLNEKRKLEKWIREAREAYLLIHFAELIMEQELNNFLDKAA